MKITIKTLFILLAFSCFSNLTAQNPLTFGVKAGMNLSDYSKDIEDNKVKPGFNAGVTVDYRLSRYFYLLSGVEVNSKGTKVSKRSIPIEGVILSTDGGKYKENWNPIYLQIPIHAGYIVQAQEDMAVLFHAGPFVSCGVGGKVTSTMNDVDEKIDAFGNDGLLKRWDFGLGLGVGFEFHKMGVNFGYDLGMLNVSKEHDRSIKTNTAHFSFSYRFQ